jgi:hypothetical protein
MKLLLVIFLYISSYYPCFGMINAETMMDPNFKKLKINSKYKRNATTIECLPKVIIHEISIYLDPISIVNLSHANKRFKQIFNEDFFLKYNDVKNYKSFKEEHWYFFCCATKKEADPLKVMIAHYYFYRGVEKFKIPLIKKSSILGLPKAQRYLEERHKNAFSNSRYNNVNYYARFAERGKRCSRCCVPKQYCKCLYGRTGTF